MWVTGQYLGLEIYMLVSMCLYVCVIHPHTHTHTHQEGGITTKEKYTWGKPLTIKPRISK